MAGVSFYPGCDVTLDDADILVNTVNQVGTMGKGVARDFFTRWPSILSPYRAACADGTIQAGRCVLFALPDGRRWAALATKAHWLNGSRMSWVRSGLLELAEQAGAVGARSIALPAPGCGNGGLDWAEVGPLVLDALRGFDLRIYARPVALTTRVINHKVERPAGDFVLIMRPTRWGNPFVAGRDGTREQVIRKYAAWLVEELRAGRVTIEELAALHGKTLVCGCKPLACHGDVLAAAAAWAWRVMHMASAPVPCDDAASHAA